jgi:hypothetical protein
VCVDDLVEPSGNVTVIEVFGVCVSVMVLVVIKWLVAPVSRMASIWCCEW